MAMQVAESQRYATNGVGGRVTSLKKNYSCLNVRIQSGDISHHMVIVQCDVWSGDLSCDMYV